MYITTNVCVSNVCIICMHVSGPIKTWACPVIIPADHSFVKGQVYLWPGGNLGLVTNA